MTENPYLKTWEEIHQQQDWGMWPSEPVVRFVSRNYGKLPNHSDIKILDFGCGIGSNTRFLAKSGYNVYAFGGSKTAIDKARFLLSNDGLAAKLSVMDALDLDYEKSFFDCIIDSACIYANTTRNIKKLYGSVYDILNSGGKLFTTGLFTTNTSGYNSGQEIEKNTFVDIKDGALAGRACAHFFESEMEIKNLLLEAGFKDIIIDTMYYTDNYRGKGAVVEYFMVSALK